MTTTLTRPSTTSSGTTRALLAGGALAGPLWTVLAAAQVLTRDGFDLTRQPISALSLGEHGWVQVCSFVVAGLLTIGLAVALRRLLRGGPGGAWGPALVGCFGLGLVLAGAFSTDPALGFPPGAPEGLPETWTWHATVHNLASMLAFSSLTAACLVLARRFAAERQRAWAVYSVATVVVTVGLFPTPGAPAATVRMALAAVVVWAWTTALAVRLSRRPSASGRPSRAR